MAKLTIPSPVLVVRYNPLFAHCPTLVVAKLAVPRFVEVVMYPGLVQVRVFPENVRPTPPKVVVVKLPEAFAERSVPVAFVKIVEELNVVVEFSASPPVNVCAADQMTEEAAVTKPELLFH